MVTHFYMLLAFICQFSSAQRLLESWQSGETIKGTESVLAVNMIGHVNSHDNQGLRSHSHRVTGRPPQYQNNALYACPQPGKEVVYLTLDDGPGKNLGELTKKMQELGINVTFFWNGANVPGSPTHKLKDGVDQDPNRAQNMRSAYLAGNVPATHGLTHSNLNSADNVQDQEGMRSHVVEGAQVIEKAIADKKQSSSPKVNLYRPPYGSWSDTADKFFASKIGAGFHVVRWDVDPQDWATGGKNVSGISSAIGQAVENGGGKKGHVILMHESSNIVTEITSVVQTIRQKCPNCEFWSVDQCFGAERAKAGESADHDPSVAAKIADALNQVLEEKTSTHEGVDLPKSGRACSDCKKSQEVENKSRALRGQERSRKISTTGSNPKE